MDDETIVSERQIAYSYCSLRLVRWAGTGIAQS